MDFSIWSPPWQIVTDGEKEYSNSVQRHLMQLFGTRHTFTSIYHPQTDGMSEVFNKTLRHFLATALLDAKKMGTSFELFLPALSHSYNSSVSHATHVSPFTTHFGTRMCVPLWPLSKDKIILDPALSKSGTFEEYVAPSTARSWSHANPRTTWRSDHTRETKISTTKQTPPHLNSTQRGPGY